MSASKAPWSSEAEQSVLGALLIDNQAIDHISELRADQFFSMPHRLVFTAITALIAAGKPADVITVFERLQAVGDARQVGGLEFISALQQGVVSSRNIVRYAEIVVSYAKARMLVAVGESAYDAAHDETRPIDERIEQVSGEVMKLLESGAQQDALRLGDLIARHTETIEARANGDVRVVPTGLADLDRMLGGGVRPGNAVVLGGRPSMGKTALALTIADHMAANSHPVGVLSMEMSKEELADRSISLIGRIDLADVQTPPTGPAADAFWSKLVEATETAAGRQLYIDDQGGLTIAQVRAKARAMKRKHNIEVLVVDYLQLMSGTDQKANRNYQLEEIMRGLKALAKSLSIGILVLAQVKRDVDGRADAMPGMSDLKDFAAEQDADVVVFIHRPIHTNPKLSEEWNFYAQLRVAKNRQGRTGLLNLTYFGHETRFANWSGPPPKGNDLASGRRKADYD